MFEQIQFSREGNDVVVGALSGEIDIANVAAIAAGLIEALPLEAVGLIVDLSAVTYIDSAGIRMLFTLGTQTETRRQRLGVVVDEGSPTQRLLKITNIHEVVVLCASVDECAAAMRDAPVL